MRAPTLLHYLTEVCPRHHTKTIKLRQSLAYVSSSDLRVKLTSVPRGGERDDGGESLHLRDWSRPHRRRFRLSQAGRCPLLGLRPPVSVPPRFVPCFPLLSKVSCCGLSAVWAKSRSGEREEFVINPVKGSVIRILASSPKSNAPAKLQ
jgi:hypothetical protein